ncbi:uncharacterized protein NPIL_342581 [Nephila pilipes]|uniref:Uncharacterized protein n=1 Tax=Nephila pilipes TaxID=299642 RepID=A0A8X6PYK0_NEPPI|nr:uncharacterized protein NPIL_342581 [Nephila pilipes]
MRNHFRFLFSCGHGCSDCKRRFWRQKEKDDEVHKCTVSNSGKRKKQRHHLPYIEMKPENEKVFTFFMKALARSTITGVNRLASSRNVIRKVLWCLVSLFCLVGFMYQAINFAVVYNSSPTEVVLRVENEGTLAFPSVTVCNNNRIRRSEFCKLYPDRCSPNVTRLEISEREFLRIHKEALVDKQFDFRYQLGHSYSIVSGCVFKGTEILKGEECLHFFGTVRFQGICYYSYRRFSLSFDPDFGNCFSFSTRGRKNGEHLAAREADFWQDENGLTINILFKAYSKIEYN